MKDMQWSERTWDATMDIYQKITQLPFINGLMDGTLERNKFEFYIQQDALYLAEYGKVLTGIASRLSNPSHIEAFIKFAGESIAVERALHQSFVTELGKGATQSPSCLLYTSYLMRQLTAAPVEVVAAAVLPCFMIYQEVGNFILANQTKGENQYQNWINTYGGEDFAASVRLATSICDQLAEQTTPALRQAMTNAFLMASRMEWMFWDSAWNMEQWKI